MLARQGVISREDADTLVKGLDQVAREIREGSFVWKPELEDVHMNVEARLTEIVGEVGKTPAHGPQPQRPGGARPSGCSSPTGLARVAAPRP